MLGVDGGRVGGLGGRGVDVSEEKFLGEDTAGGVDVYG